MSLLLFSAILSTLAFADPTLDAECTKTYMESRKIKLGSSGTFFHSRLDEKCITRMTKFNPASMEVYNENIKRLDKLLIKLNSIVLKNTSSRSKILDVLELKISSSLDFMGIVFFCENEYNKNYSKCQKNIDCMA